MERLKEIEQRKLEIRSLLEDENAEIDVDSLKIEVDALEEEERSIREEIDAEEKRHLAAEAEKRAIAEKLNKRAIAPDKEIIIKEEITMDYTTASPEFRSAWLKKLQGKELNDVELRAGEIIASQVPGAIPEDTQNMIMTKIRTMAPLLNEIQLLQVAGNVSIMTEGTVNAAAIHTENGAVTPAADTTLKITLGGYEYIKVIRISATIKTMAVPAFESWITDQIAEQVALKIEADIVAGTGSGAPKGIDKSQTWTDGSNAVEYTTNITYAELIELVGALKGGYHRTAKLYMNHKTFWSQIQNIRDDGKAPIVSGDNGNYRCMGFQVVFSDSFADGDIFFGDMKKVIVGNLSQNVTVEMSTQSGFLNNSYDYRGVALFDCTVAIAEAVVKAYKAGI